MRISAFNRSCERKQSHMYPSKSLKKVAISFDHDPILFSTANPADEVFGRHRSGSRMRRERVATRPSPAPSNILAVETQRRYDADMHGDGRPRHRPTGLGGAGGDTGRHPQEGPPACP